MRTAAIHFMLALLALLTAASSAAQTFDNIAAGDASTVCSIVQDTQGLVWLGTERGLMAYDGYRTIAHATASDGTPANVRIHSMCIYRNTIYLGTERGLMAYDIRRGQYAANGATPLKDVRAVCAHAGSLWLGSAQGLYRRDLASGKTRGVNTRLRDIYALLPTGRGLLVGTLDGLWLADNGGKARRIRIGEGHQPLVNALLADNGCVWVGTEGALYRYDWHTLQPVAQLGRNSIKSLAQQGDQLYAGTDNGLYIYNKVTHRTRHALHDSRSTRSIANNIVWSVMADRWGNLWAGTDQGVSAMYSRPFFTLTPLGDITGTGDGNCLHLIQRGNDGMMWLGGTNGLIGYSAKHGFMPDNKAGVMWFSQTSAAHYMSHNRVRRVYTDNGGTTIVCTDHGLNIYNPQTRQMRNVIVVDRSHRYSTAWAYDIVDDGMGRYWICSYMGGVFVIAKERLLNAAAGIVTADRHFVRELQGKHVWQLVKDGRGRIWARMYDRGLDRIDPHTMRVEHIVGKDRLINDLCTDREGNVWAAMDGEIRCFGMTAAANRSMRISGYSSEDAALLCEVEGDIWAIMGHDCCLITRSGASTRFAMPGFKPLAICYDRTSGCVLLGGNDAVANIPAKSVSVRQTRGGNAAARGRGAAVRPPLFLLSGITVDGKPLAPDDGCPTYLDRLTLNARQNNVTFLMSDLPYAGQQPQVYVYRLDGADRTWQYMDSERREISYNALPPGTYTLEVKQVDGLGEARDTVYSMDMTILPPWYLSAWAKALYMIAAACLATGAMYLYMMRRRLREEQVAKERIMQESAARSTFFDNLSRQLRRPLGTLSGAVLGCLHDATGTAEAQRLDAMRRDTARLNTLVFHAFDMQQAYADDDTCRTTVNMADLCRYIAGDARTRCGKAVDIVFRTSTPTAYAETDAMRIQPVMDELIDFAAANRKDSRPVTIDLNADGGKVTITVGIPGMTIADSDMPLVFNRYFTIGGDSARQGTGTNALALVREFAQHNGAETAAQNTDYGTAVTLAFCQSDAGDGKRSAQDAATGARHAPTPAPQKDTADARLLAKITDTVEEHMADSDFNVTRLQETLGIGSKLLYRKIKQMTGKTPVEFMRHIRMQRAAMLLREGRFAVTEVMYMVGFSNSSYFAKCFQKTYGITPTEYSRQ